MLISFFLCKFASIESIKLEIYENPEKTICGHDDDGLPDEHGRTR